MTAADVLAVHLANARTAEELLKFARRYGLTHVVIADPPGGSDAQMFGDFRDRYTTLVWHANGRAVLAIGTGDAGVTASPPDGVPAR